MRRILLYSAAIAALSCLPTLASAQTKPGRPPRKTTTKPSNATAAAGTGTAGRTALPITFGAWLDDASTMMPGRGSLSVAIGRWSALDGGQTDLPVFDFSVGISDRLQVSAGLPFYQATYSDGYKSSGRGDMYVLITVTTPTNLSSEQKKLLKELAKTLPPDAIPQEKGLIDHVREVLISGGQ